MPSDRHIRDARTASSVQRLRLRYYPTSQNRALEPNKLPTLNELGKQPARLLPPQLAGESLERLLSVQGWLQRDTSRHVSLQLLTAAPAAARCPAPPTAAAAGKTCKMGTNGAMAASPEHPPHEGHWDNVGE